MATRVIQFNAVGSKSGGVCVCTAVNKTNLLEKVGSISETEKGYSVGHHPDVASAAVKVGFTPFTIFVGNAENLVIVTFRVCRFVGRVCVIS